MIIEATNYHSVKYLWYYVWNSQLPTILLLEGKYLLLDKRDKN